MQVAVVRCSSATISEPMVAKSISDWDEVDENTYRYLYENMGAYRYDEKNDEYIFLLTRMNIEVYLHSLKEIEKAKEVRIKVQKEQEIKHKQEQEEKGRLFEIKRLQELKEKYPEVK